jgi:hypothetical protein
MNNTKNNMEVSASGMPWARFGWATTALVAAVGVGVGCNDETTVADTQLASVGQCVRDQAVLRGPVESCDNDAQCPCGSFCDPVENTCRFECNLPPQSPSEACDSGTQCDDTGR